MKHPSFRIFWRMSLEMCAKGGKIPSQDRLNQSSLFCYFLQGGRKKLRALRWPLARPSFDTQRRNFPQRVEKKYNCRKSALKARIILFSSLRKRLAKKLLVFVFFVGFNSCFLNDFIFHHFFLSLCGYWKFSHTQSKKGGKKWIKFLGTLAINRKRLQFPCKTSCTLTRVLNLNKCMSEKRIFFSRNFLGFSLYSEVTGTRPQLEWKYFFGVQ